MPSPATAFAESLHNAEPQTRTTSLAVVVDHGVLWHGAEFNFILNTQEVAHQRQANRLILDAMPNRVGE